MTTQTPDYAPHLASALSIARTAGATIHTAFHNRTSLHIDLKNANDADLVTQVDRNVEAAIFSHLRAQFPSHRFVGEEGTAAAGDAHTGLGDHAEDDTPTWVVDPVDGTTNFVHGFPFVAVSIALVVRGIPVVGVVHNPVMNETFHAVIGQGAFLNDVPIPTPPLRPLASLASALIATEYGSDRGEEILGPKVHALHDIVSSPARGVRSLGSAALTMCYVARGALDAYWEAGVHAWDVAAAAVILTEAGGLVANWKDVNAGGAVKYDLCARNVVCVRKTPEGAQARSILEGIRGKLTPVEYTRD
ncbi:inositol monophosphatase 1-like protein [Fimicolochytrium jonesii]|uniref:inositol monophosphatase 1-like protein n=1 Tax=Fimicolochytrium jonesii TaxID=1396493 RepID=UPI0022FDE07A|nr:inositol monophosphatase 1-like protein [Fimicolochytrium jonesii]KAI8822434.1 inositol monophosphatase 1-like protein [Fimicolochytrium jonesii]